MANFKENPRYNVVSIRVTDQEKKALEKMTRRSRKSISKLMREAIQLYIPLLEASR